MPYVVHLHGYLVESGTTIELKEIDSLKFEVLENHEKHFDVRWLSGSHPGTEDKLPYSIFGEENIEVVYVEDEPEPNSAFRLRKLLNE